MARGSLSCSKGFLLIAMTALPAGLPLPQCASASNEVKQPNHRPIFNHSASLLASLFKKHPLQEAGKMWPLLPEATWTFRETELLLASSPRGLMDCSKKTTGHWPPGQPATILWPPLQGCMENLARETLSPKLPVLLARALALRLVPEILGARVARQPQPQLYFLFRIITMI